MWKSLLEIRRSCRLSYEERANERFGKVNEELRVCGIKAIFFSSITNPSTRFVNGLVYTAVGILVHLQ